MCSKSIIRCSSLEQFLDAVEGLTKRGILFDAEMGGLVITLTGGF